MREKQVQKPRDRLEGAVPLVMEWGKKGQVDRLCWELGL